MEHTLHIEKIITGGRGLARLDTGKVIMVPFVLPGETVLVTEDTNHTGYATGTLLQVIKPAKGRITPPCIHYGTCGGCNLQHIDYQTQVKIKRDIVDECFARACQDMSGTKVEPCITSPDQWAYRSRLRLQLQKDGQPGLFQRQSHQIIPIQQCPLAHQKIQVALKELLEKNLLQTVAGQCREIEFLLSPDSQQVFLVFIAREQGKGKINIDQLSSCQHIHAVILKTGRKSIPLVPLNQSREQSFCLSQKIPDPSCNLSWSNSCFSQINTQQNRQLIGLVCTLAANIYGKTVLDLFCGMGNFSIPLALNGAAVTGIEWNKESIKWARINAEQAGVQCRFYSGDVKNTLHELIKSKQSVHTILLDPPRRGLGKTTTLLPELEPETIIYISCDPATLARDVALLNKKGYSLDCLIPVDMFPQTHHIEAVALLKKN